MQNKLPNDKMNELINAASKKMGTSPDELKKKLESGQIDQILSGVNQQDAKNIKDVLNNPNQIKAILDSPQAKQLLGNLMKGKK